MDIDKRTALAALWSIGGMLGSVVLYDVGEDWLVQGNALWSTLVENSLPLALVAVLFVAGWRLATGEYRDKYVSSVTKWTVAGLAAMLVLSTLVVGLQVFQGQLKPRIIVVQTSIVGAVAGLLVGYNTAEVEQARDHNRHERQRFESLFENDPAAIADLRLVDGELVVEAGNEAFEAAFGDVAADATLVDVLPEADEETWTAVREHVEGGERYETRRRLNTATGRREFTVRVVPYSVDAGTGSQHAYVIYRDVTDLKQAQRRLERTVAQLKRSNEQLQQFAYVASHDLQEPLRMVSSYVDLLADEYGDDLDEEAEEYMEYAVDGATRMQDMIDDLLQYSRVRTQGQEFVDTDAEAVLEDTLNDLELLVEETDATVTVGDLPTVTADRNQLGQLFQNLLKNAIEHGAEESPTVRVDAERDGDGVVFSVADDGPGIPADQQEGVFEIFEQGSRDDEGTGIGLAVCQRIVNRHGGDIWVESTAGEGATFRFRLPDEAPQQSTGPADQPTGEA
jgi:chemotaxis family two-component system sensor kinase Cph1